MKIFAYGCSFTSYNWPSYADILGLKYDIVNRGSSGSGNEKIFYFLMEDIKNNLITSNDIVITQWSGTNRFNYLKTNGWWIGDGNVLLPHNKWIYSKIKGWFNPEYEHNKTVNLILAAQSLLKDIRCNHVEMSLNPILEVDSNFLENDLQDTYPGEYIFTEFSWKTLDNALHIDSHPTVLQHYDIVQRITQSLNIELSVDYTLIETLHNKINQDTIFGSTYCFKDVQ